MKSETKRKSRIKIIPNSVFADLWMNANKFMNKSDFLRNYTRAGSKDYIDFAKYGLEYEEGISLINEIYEKASLSFKEIVDLSGKSKSEISYAFCIPIRTIEDWYTGKNKCIPYVRLAILRQYRLFNLGKYVHTEFEDEYKASAPKTYNKKIESDKNSGNDSEDYRGADEMEPLDEIDNLLFKIRNKREAIFNDSYRKTQSIMDSTSFIDDILRKKGNKKN